MKKILIALALICASMLAICSCSKDKGKGNEKSAEEIKYEKAISLISTGAYEESYKLFTELGDYKDSAKYRSKFYYTPVKIECTEGEENGFIEILLNADNLQLKQTRVINGELDWTTDYVYGENGRPIKYISGDGDVSTITEDIYYENNRCIKSLIKDEDGVLEGICEYTYDDKGRITKTVFTDLYNDEPEVMTLESVFDEKGNVIKESYSDSFGDETVTNYSYIYNENGTIAKRIVDGEDEYVYSYDDNGKLVKVVYPEVDADVYESWGEEFLDYMLGMQPQEYNVTYDDKGNVKKVAITYANGDVRTIEFTLKFVYIAYDSYDVQADIDSQLANGVSTFALSIGSVTFPVNPDIGSGEILDPPSGSPVEGPMVDITPD